MGNATLSLTTLSVMGLIAKLSLNGNLHNDVLHNKLYGTQHFNNLYNGAIAALRINYKGHNYS